mgnify:FL=1
MCSRCLAGKTGECFLIRTELGAVGWVSVTCPLYTCLLDFQEGVGQALPDDKRGGTHISSGSA